jgi:hypothetical protein
MRAIGARAWDIGCKGIYYDMIFERLHKVDCGFGTAGPGMYDSNYCKRFERHMRGMYVL